MSMGFMVSIIALVVCEGFVCVGGVKGMVVCVVVGIGGTTGVVCVLPDW